MALASGVIPGYASLPSVVSSSTHVVVARRVPPHGRELELWSCPEGARAAHGQDCRPFVIRLSSYAVEEVLHGDRELLLPSGWHPPLSLDTDPLVIEVAPGDWERDLSNHARYYAGGISAWVYQYEYAGTSTRASRPGDDREILFLKSRRRGLETPGTKHSPQTKLAFKGAREAVDMKEVVLELLRAKADGALGRLNRSFVRVQRVTEGDDREDEEDYLGRRALPGLENCHVTVLGLDPEVGGRLVVDIKTQSQDVWPQTEVIDDRLQNERMLRCVESVLQSHFAYVQDKRTFRVSLEFTRIRPGEQCDARLALSRGNSRAGFSIKMQTCRDFSGGRLDKGAIQEFLSKKRRRLSSCYWRVARRNPNAGGQLTLEVTIDLEGRAATRVISDKTCEPKIPKCVTGVFQRWSFPKPQDEPAQFTLPIDFNFL